MSHRESSGGTCGLAGDCQEMGDHPVRKETRTRQEEQDSGTESLSPTRREDMFEEVISTSPKKPALQPRAEQATGERCGLCSWMRRQLQPMTLCR